jgi:hypothetical protein
MVATTIRFIEELIDAFNLGSSINKWLKLLASLQGHLQLEIAAITRPSEPPKAGFGQCCRSALTEANKRVSAASIREQGTAVDLGGPLSVTTRRPRTITLVVADFCLHYSERIARASLLGEPKHG